MSLLNLWNFLFKLSMELSIEIYDIYLFYIGLSHCFDEIELFDKDRGYQINCSKNTSLLMMFQYTSYSSTSPYFGIAILLIKSSS